MCLPFAPPPPGLCSQSGFHGISILLPLGATTIRVISLPRSDSFSHTSYGRLRVNSPCRNQGAQNVPGCGIARTSFDKFGVPPCCTNDCVQLGQWGGRLCVCAYKMCSRRTQVRKSRSIAHPAGAGPVTISFIHFGSASSDGIGSCEWCVPAMQRVTPFERV